MSSVSDDVPQGNVAARKLNANNCEDIDEYEHMGCFNDSDDDRVLAHVMKDDEMTPDVRKCSLLAVSRPLLRSSAACIRALFSSVKRGQESGSNEHFCS